MSPIKKITAALTITTSVVFASGHKEGEIKLVNKDYQQPIQQTYSVSSSGEFDETVLILSDNLLTSSRIPSEDIGSIAITSFVNLHDLSSTSGFGRTLAESFFNELFVRGFNVSDFRGQDALTVNPTGEFFITRDVNKIANKIQNSYVLVGTYSIIEHRVLINARIMDNMTGNIVASAKAYHSTTDCNLLNNCPKPRTIRIVSNSIQR
ncbi:MAG: FlgO family outer membrane protein [Campylobacterota bacterium]|nr:FlgO family outer membrane protein [Campylobacterota bacterium]